MPEMSRPMQRVLSLLGAVYLCKRCDESWPQMQLFLRIRGWTHCALTGRVGIGPCIGISHIALHGTAGGFVLAGLHLRFGGAGTYFTLAGSARRGLSLRSRDNGRACERKGDKSWQYDV
jgi:hypothetical protein